MSFLAPFMLWGGFAAGIPIALHFFYRAHYRPVPWGAMKFLLMRMKILVEPSGAVPAAAVLYRTLPPGVGRVGVVLSGGNVDFDQLAGF